MSNQKDYNKMNKIQAVASLGALALFLLVAVPDSAHAYLDPGTGSMILQILAAGLVTATVVFRKSIARLGAMFRRGKGSSQK